MSSSWVDLATIFDPVADAAPPATWGDQIRENEQHLYERVERVIARTVLNSAASSISSGTLPTVANGWTLRAVVLGQHASSTGINLSMRFNGDTGTNYHRQYVAGADTTLSADGQDALDRLYIGVIGNENASRWAVADLTIYDYLSSKHKALLGRSHYPGNLTTTAFANNVGGVWKSTAAITSVSAHAESGNFAAGSSLTIYATPYPV